MKCIWTIAVVLVVSFASVASFAQTSKPAAAFRQFDVTLTLTDGKVVRGRVVAIDDTTISLRDADQRSVAIKDVTPASLYMVKRQMLDLSRGSSHMELGQYLLANGLRDMAEREFEEAVALDPELDKQIEQIRRGVATSQPRTTSQATSQPHFKPASVGAGDDHRKAAQDIADRTKKLCAPTMHLVESTHFLIYSTLDKAKDDELRTTLEGLYQQLCSQFDLPVAGSIYVGKCPVFVMIDKDIYGRFCNEVVGAKVPGDSAGHYGADNKGCTYVAIGDALAADPKADITARIKAGYEVLVHETTHSFMARYLTDHVLPPWVNEGIADAAVAQVLANTDAKQRYVTATMKGIRATDTRTLLDWTGDKNSYGMAQSVIRYMQGRDHAAFIKFVTALKDGKDETDALNEAFKTTRDQLLKDWRDAAIKNPPKG